ncbi:AMP-binding enzyme [Massilia niabensis]|uniref:AMP-binding protein n=1 Tax=Massilia niabensis TaxID=544910 RepID=A0ABW0L5E2_9BURK
MDPFERAQWWRHAPSLERVVRDLLAFELAQARPGRVLPLQPWPAELDLVADLGADSLDLMGAGTALGDLLGFGRSGMMDALLGRPLLAGWVEAARTSLAGHDAELVFRTSGSSGAPKRCTHSLASLWREVDALARLVPGRRRMLSAVPAHHIYGFLFTVLLPQAGREALPVLDLRAQSPASLAAWLEPGDLVVAHPDFWAQVAALGPEFPPDVTGVTSTAPCPDAVAQALAGGGLRLLQVYGSSETAGVGWRDAAAEPYRLFPYWRRTDIDNTLERDGAGGVERQALQDRLVWSGPDRFVPNGRIDSAVQVGGTNVFPVYVAEVLAMHPGVAECVVRPMRPDEGTRLKAFVVPKAGAHDATALRVTLSSWIGERLAPAECPAAYSFGSALPRQPSGKLTDWIIDAWD